MIPGTAAQAEILAILVEPPNLLGQFDFVNGIYQYDSVSYTAADVIDQPGWIGAGGLNVPIFSQANIILAALKTRLATCQWTIVLEVETLSLVQREIFFWEGDATDSYFIDIEFNAEWRGNSSSDVSSQTVEDFTHSISTAIHRVAVTRRDSRFSLSVDGFDTEVDATTCTLPVIGSPMTVFSFGAPAAFGSRPFNIRSFSLYDPVINLQLPLLSVSQAISGAVTLGGRGSLAVIANVISSGPQLYNAAANFAGTGNLSCALTPATVAYSGSAVLAGSGRFQADFSPTDLGSTLKLWLDFSDTTTITASAGAVSAVTDKSGAGNHVSQSTAGLKPTTGANTLNGRNVLTFTADYITRDGPAVDLPTPDDGSGGTNTDGMTMVCLRKIDSGTSGATIAIFNSGASYGDSSSIGLVGGNTSAWGNGGGTSAAIVAQFADADTTNWHCDSAIYLRTTRTIFQDGTSKNTNNNSVTTAATTSLYIGHALALDRGSAFDLTGKIAEVIVLNGRSVANRQKIEGYIMWKWGLQANLPVGHPYAGGAP